MSTWDFIITHGYDIAKLVVEVVTILYGVVKFIEKKLIKLLEEHFFLRADGDRIEAKLDQLSQDMGYGQADREKPRIQVH